MNPVTRGWIYSYGAYQRSSRVLNLGHIDHPSVKRAKWKCKKRRSPRRAEGRLGQVAFYHPELLANCQGNA